jgi:hypothetical protein
MPDKACAGSTCEESARDIFVSGTDVYIAGTQYTFDGVGSPTSIDSGYWKNDEWHILQGSESSRIEVVDGHVYTSGWVDGAGAIWKDDSTDPFVAIDNADSASTSVLPFAILGSTIYASSFVTGGGYDANFFNSQTSHYTAFPQPEEVQLEMNYWLCDMAEVKSSTSDGTHWYAGGYIEWIQDRRVQSSNRFPLWNRQLAGYWVEGTTWVQLTGEEAAIDEERVNDMAIDGSDIYAAGYSQPHSLVRALPQTAGYWLNGTWTELPSVDPDQSSEALAIAVAP